MQRSKNRTEFVTGLSVDEPATAQPVNPIEKGSVARLEIPLQSGQAPAPDASEQPGSAKYFGTSAPAGSALIDPAPETEEAPVGDPPSSAAYRGEVADLSRADAAAAAESVTGFLPGSPEYLGQDDTRAGATPASAAEKKPCCGDWFRASDDVRAGFLSGNTFLDKPVTYGVINGVPIFEGDIALGPEQLREAPGAVAMDHLPASGVAITGDRYRWPGGILPWQTQPALRTRVLAAIDHWHANTGIRFVERTAANASRYPDYVSFEVRDGCWSYVGRQGGMQVISLAAGCGFGAAVHEIGHALGLWHEQSREDRSRFIRIHYENISPGNEHNFNQHITDGDDIRGYDFDSIMHYGPTAFSRNGQPTITAIGGQAIGQRNGLSSNDVAAIHTLYPLLPPSTRQHSGYFLQSRFGTNGNFELVAPRPGGGIAHYWRNNDAPTLPWSGATPFGSGAISDVSCIQSNFGPGNLELVARQGSQLVFYWRTNAPPFTWGGPFPIPGATNVSGNPALIQSTHGTRGNFELVVPSAAGGMMHFWRNNDHPSLPWSAPTRFGRGRIEGVCLLQANFGQPGNLELVAREGNQLVFYWRSGQAPFTWSGPFPIPGSAGVTGVPALIQSSHGVQGNFELVAPLASGGMVHFWRDNDAPDLPWRGPTRFGRGSIQAVSLFQGTFGTPGNLELVAREGNRLAFYWRSGQAPYNWSGPFYIA